MGADILSVGFPLHFSDGLIETTQLTDIFRAEFVYIVATGFGKKKAALGLKMGGVDAATSGWLCRWPWIPVKNDGFTWIYYESITSTKYITLINAAFFFWGGDPWHSQSIWLKGKKGMVYSLLLLPNIAWPFLFTSIHSLSMPATPLYKWDFFWIRNSCWDPWWSIYSDIYIWFYDIIYYIYIIILHIIYMFLVEYVCIYQKAACSSCFILAVSGFSVSAPRFHELITKERPENLTSTRQQGLTASKWGHVCFHHTGNDKHYDGLVVLMAHICSLFLTLNMINNYLYYSWCWSCFWSHLSWSLLQRVQYSEVLPRCLGFWHRKPGRYSL